MNFTILLFLCLLIFTALWLSAKFLGKIGLYVFASISFLLAGYFTIGVRTSVSFLTANVGLDVCFFIPAFFTLFLISKKYGLGDGIKLGLTMISISLLNALAMFVYWLYRGVGFFAVLSATLAPFFISLLALVVAVTIIFLLYRKSFTKFKESFRTFLILGIAISANTFFFVTITEATLSVPFFQIMLDFLITYLWQVLILGALIIFSNRVIKINDNSNFGNALKEKFDEAILKAKETISSQKEEENSNEEVIIENNQENSEEKIDEIIIEAEKKEEKKD